MSRAEVKRIVAGNFATAKIDAESFPRALRVLTGWRTSNIYSVRGKPRKLHITGRAPSFYSLCKAFSGDIPHRVILDELERQRRVIVTKDRCSVSIARPRKFASKNRQHQDALAFAAGFLADALRPGKSVVRRKEKISTSGRLPDVYVENSVVSRVTDLLDHMPELFQGNRKSKRAILNVYALVTRDRD